MAISRGATIALIGAGVPIAAATLLGWLWLTPGRRAIDAHPKEFVASQRLRHGRAVAAFETDTGGDQMSMRPVQFGLVFTVRFGDKQFRQTIASCDELGHGDVLSSGAPNELDVAVCDDREFGLLSDGGKAYVEERIPGRPPRPISEVALPDGIERAERV